MSGRVTSIPPNRHTVATAAATISPTDVLVAVTNTAAAVTLTLPAANSVPSGRMIVVKDASGGAATHNITVTAAGSDHIDAGTTSVISTNYGVVRLMSNGSNGWDVV